MPHDDDKDDFDAVAFALLQQDVDNLKKWRDRINMVVWGALCTLAWVAVSYVLKATELL